MPRNYGASTCHPTQVNAARINPARQASEAEEPFWVLIKWLEKVRKFTYPGGMEGWVDRWLGYLGTYQDGVPARRQSPIQELTGPGVD